MDCVFLHPFAEFCGQLFSGGAVKATRDAFQLERALLDRHDVCLRVATFGASDAFADEFKNLVLELSLINALWSNNAVFVNAAGRQASGPQHL